MNILLIGNGFDIEHNLPTSYKDFLEFCQKVKSIYEFPHLSIQALEEEFLNNWDIDDSIKNGIFLAFKSLRFPSSDPQPDINYQKINELYSYVQNNIWLNFFWARCAEIGHNWIDFESEISEVIKVLDYTKKHLSDYQRLLIDSPKSWNVLVKIISASQEMLEEVVQDSDAIEEFTITLVKDLNLLIRSLEIYISLFINNIKVECLSQDIQGINPDCVLSFNYSNTYERLYGTDKNVKYSYIHGKAKLSNSVESCNIVLGIDEYLKGDFKNTELDFLPFKKYYQRIYKLADNVYLDWIDEIKDEYINYLKEVEAIHLIPNKQILYPHGNPGRIYFNDLLPRYPTHTLYIFGHSLDVTDQDVLKMLICNDNVQTKIFYHRNSKDDKKSLDKIIRNLIGIMGQEELIRRTGGVHKTIEFIPQALRS